MLSTENLTSYGEDEPCAQVQATYCAADAKFTSTRTSVQRTSRVVASLSRHPAWSASTSACVHATPVKGFVVYVVEVDPYVPEFGQSKSAAPVYRTPSVLITVRTATADAVVLRHQMFTTTDDTVHPERVTVPRFSNEFVTELDVLLR